ncbi:MAG: glycosyltransferase, partial [Chloroflexi bacterium]|nr:glycosyltransferase [Chloroflexota bacterium]
QTPRYLCAADCSVDPVYDTPASRSRSPLKIVESMALGVPVVTGDVGDRREMLANGGAGVLVHAGAAQALARGVLRVLCDGHLREQLACGARARAAAYDWAMLAPRWAQVYA